MVDGSTIGSARAKALGHRRGLDGLRGLAVLGVLFYHQEISWARGGFLAISTFFTLSGFLISGVLLRSHLQPGGSLRAFWARRARRLMPAAFVALCGIVVFGATVATRQQVRALPADVVGAATWTANWRFILAKTSYVNLFAAPSPVQHFWSLAIEEQFYLALPLGMILLLRRTSSARVIGGALAGASLLSTAWMVVLYEHGASLDRLYYGTDTRVAELLAGAALGVFVWNHGADFAERTRTILATTGIVALAATLWCWGDITLADGPIWRGGFLLVALASCVVILGVLADRGPLAALMSWPPFVATGRISYGVYLYHWPIFLWLTADRTGLSLWPLFALRLAVTFGVATVSYRYLEKPILQGKSFGLRGRARFVLAPVVAIVVIVAAFATGQRDAYDPLAALNAAASTNGKPPPGTAGPLKLLVIPSASNDPVVAELERRSRGNAELTVMMTAPFECVGGLSPTKFGSTCTNWARTWPSTIEKFDPDAVLLYVDSWKGDKLSSLAGVGSTDATATAAGIVGPALDLLTARGAHVVSAYSGSYAAGATRSNAPLFQALLRLQASRTDVFSVIGLPDKATVSPAQFVSRSTATLLASADLYRRVPDRGEPRVMVVGDSQALSLGYGLDQWATQNKRALIWNHGIEGCGLVVDGEVSVFGSTGSSPRQCRDAVQAWPDQIKTFKPSAVVVLASLSDLQPRRVPGTSKFASIGDPKFDAFLVSQYVAAVDALSATGAQVVWMTPPCLGLDPAGVPLPYSALNMRLLGTQILPAVVRERPGKVKLFDLASIICPAGKPLKSVPGVSVLRPDGVHFSVDGSLWFARKYGTAVLKLAGL